MINTNGNYAVLGVPSGLKTLPPVPYASGIRTAVDGKYYRVFPDGSKLTGKVIRAGMSNKPSEVLILTSSVF